MRFEDVHREQADRYRKWQLEHGIINGRYHELTGLGFLFYAALWLVFLAVGIPIGVALFTLTWRFCSFLVG